MTCVHVYNFCANQTYTHTMIYNLYTHIYTLGNMAVLRV